LVGFSDKSEVYKLFLNSGTAEFYCSLEEGVRGELLRRYSDFHREGNFPESKLSGFCSGGIRNTQSTSKNVFFAPAVFYSSRAPCGCSALREILLLEEI
jgi:hypothetical protein